MCTSFQGLCVAMLFCFCNAEVITVIKKKLKDTFNLKSSNFKRQKRLNSASGAGNGPYSTTTTLVNNCHFNDNNNGARSLKSVISSADLLAQPQSQLGRSNGTNSNNSNSSSLMTTVTASPIQVALSSAAMGSLLRDPKATSNNNNNNNIDSKLETAVSDLGQPLASNNNNNNNRRPSLGLDKEETVNLLQHQDHTCSVTTSFSVA